MQDDYALSLAMAEASARAYDLEPHLAAEGVEARIETSDARVVVAFRGTTANFSDILNDLRGIPWRDPSLGWCHSGFLKPVRAFWPELRRRLAELGAEPSEILFTGHSKGAAEATIAAALVTIDPAFGPPGGLFTFGSPRVGFAQLGEVLRPVHTERWVNGWDAVATHPWALIGYRHVGEKLSTYPGRNRWEDHRIARYVRAIGLWATGVIETPPPAEPMVGQDSEIED